MSSRLNGTLVFPFNELQSFPATPVGDFFGSLFFFAANI